jgi:hypothetical protein
MESTTWRFQWTPGSTSGTVTFSAAVAASFEDTFLVTACLPDLQAGSIMGYIDTSTTGRKLLHARARRALRQSSSEHAHHHHSNSDAIISCEVGVDSSMMHHDMGAMPSAFTASATWSSSVFFPGAIVDGGSTFAVLISCTIILAAATSALARWSVPREAAAAPSQHSHAAAWRQHVLTATGVTARAAAQYCCMLLAMTFSIWVLLALMTGHAAEHVVAATRARRRRSAAWSACNAAADEQSRAVRVGHI